jgi:two-component system chemotaxis sensor kinase CheA
MMSLLRLPTEISEAERKHVGRVNRAALAFFAMHLPVLVALAFLNHTGPLAALLLTSAAMLGPALAYFSLENPRTIAMVNGVTSMLMGGLLVHFGQGPLQIEMHFYFFAVLAMLAAYGNPLVVLGATATVALHHLVLWFALPASVFNYDAPVWVVAVHALFVVLESVAVCFIARTFFDSVIGLEKVVAARTAELDRKNAEMRLVLDHVGQGLFTIDKSGKLPRERSAILGRWFGDLAEGEPFYRCFAAVSPEFARDTEIGWAEVVEGTMPLEITLFQMPKRLVAGGRHYDVGYEPIEGEDSGRFLVVVSDVTAEVERIHLEEDKKETMALLEHALSDRTGFARSMDEASVLVEEIATHHGELATLRRNLHTLKATSAFLGVASVSTRCHALESELQESTRAPSDASIAELRHHWTKVASAVERLLGERHVGLELSELELEVLESAIDEGAPHREIAEMIADLKREPTARRLEQFAEQARQIAIRLGKPAVDVKIVDHGVRLDPRRYAKFFGALVHAVRNAVDHGIETSAARVVAGKPPQGKIELAARIEAAELWVEVRDDGRGIDWEAVGARAKAAGFPVETHDDLVAALFRDGVSTADELTEISGRGIGMGALLAAVEELGGRVEVETMAGFGTTIRAVFRRAAGRSLVRDESHAAIAS